MIPKLNDTPKYDLKIPSLNKEVKFRPYLVKEEKILMMAFESNDQKVALNAVADTIVSCISEDVKVNQLKLYDIEYMFTKIRAKSIGEDADLVVTCTDCQHKNDVKVNLDDVILSDPGEINNMIQLNDEISIEMTYPDFSKTLANQKVFEQTSEVESLIELITDCIVCINTEEEKIMIRDEPREKITEFVDSMTNEQFAKLRTYVESVPKVEIPHEYVCGGCKSKKEVKIRNISDFF
tara:strand:+ start:450 stop:1160 length:711 start_codon:yes stop_codon:yes gene_type:complete